MREYWKKLEKLANRIRQEQSRVIPIEAADTVNWMLRDVGAEGSGRAAFLYNREVAGKTGTSEGNRDLWFIGSIPQLTTGVWLGKDDNSQIEGSSGDAAFVWKQFTLKVAKDMKAINFPKKPSLKKLSGENTNEGIQ